MPKSKGSFNEAEAFTPRIQGTGKHVVLLDEASMRPRLLHLGYWPCRENNRVKAIASMRPRLLHLGYRDERRRDGRTFLSLQ